MSAAAILAIIGVVTLVGALIAMIICVEDDADTAFTAFILLVVTTVSLFITAAAISSGDRDRRNRAEQHDRDVTNLIVTKACYPRVVTNRVESDNVVVFDCARDGRLRSVAVKH